jgi:hypothetical protein
LLLLHRLHAFAVLVCAMLFGHAFLFGHANQPFLVVKPSCV